MSAKNVNKLTQSEKVSLVKPCSAGSPSCVGTNKQEVTNSQPRMNSFSQLCIAAWQGGGCKNILCLSLTWARASCEVIAVFMLVKRGNLLIVSLQGFPQLIEVEFLSFFLTLSA